MCGVTPIDENYFEYRKLLLKMCNSIETFIANGIYLLNDTICFITYRKHNENSVIDDILFL